MYTNDFSVLSFADYTGSRGSPRLHIRWPTATNPTLQPFPVERTSPDMVTFDNPTSVQPFTVDDAADPVPEFAVALIDPDAKDRDVWFRSGPLTTLPPRDPAHRTGFFAVVVAPPTERSQTQINVAIATALAGTPTSSGSDTVTAATVTIPAPTAADAFTLTVTGTHVGPLPTPPVFPGEPPDLPGILAAAKTVFWTYTADTILRPARDPFETDRIVFAEVRPATIAFAASSGAAPVAGVASGVQAAFLNVIAPLIALVEHDFVEKTIEDLIDKSIRDAVSLSLGIPPTASGAPGPLPTTVTITVQQITVFGATNSLRFDGSVGAIGPVTTPATTGGGGCALLVAIGIGSGLAMRALFS